ncbi:MULTISPECIES: YggS family pyridoxal phosphate-dependent enzyme [Halorhodospira]|uniref:YggS family pyridoxal phosphate-dependent enzyme n=1 Tax=Halorhodospira TaxID=85108 RepID=UPI0019125B7F|nr:MULTISPECIES: YggS family pyridoxal phosphate-dependent enzyme [Halorhodospira]MBK5943266.1 YggS family pyridoxal phosphate enzyme [Halorhodospira halophila]MCG5526788.1 YggS family pyridoxal phosphate-dependent enzyme [Halorhodospira halophila]MCG5533360.1 YggS family pyridoxal phosphate-dependent enzyme [Halorhodospira sp. 9621]MCG5537803.1 YggS family pyridoxal phosphate-dependent enzyme [Halorhodospira sp. 9622]MCG5540731.1 YggS family pyridoxal phosphate-dependent enzyme [Halorhodospir
MSEIASRLAAVQERVRAAEASHGRPAGSVQILAVSKRHPGAAIRAAHAAGQPAFGENYLQEAAEKQAELADLDIQWHFIGGVQSNKTREVAERFDWIHTVDRAKIARRLSEQRPSDREALNVCLQVNISEEPQKAGCPPDDVFELAAAVDGLPRLRLRGLMALPAPAEAFAEQRQPLARLRKLREELHERGHRELDTLSMGMSADLEAAIAEGATIIRIGTAIFGPRM